MIQVLVPGTSRGLDLVIEKFHFIENGNLERTSPTLEFCQEAVAIFPTVANDLFSRSTQVTNARFAALFVAYASFRSIENRISLRIRFANALRFSCSEN